MQVLAWNVTFPTVLSSYGSQNVRSGYMLMAHNVISYDF